MMPGGLSHDVQQGHELSEEKQQTFISFLDLAAGMVEVADADARWDGKHVSVVLKGGRKAKIEYWAPVILVDLPVSLGVWVVAVIEMASSTEEVRYLWKIQGCQGWRGGACTPVVEAGSGS